MFKNLIGQYVSFTVTKAAPKLTFTCSNIILPATSNGNIAFKLTNTATNSVVDSVLVELNPPVSYPFNMITFSTPYISESMNMDMVIETSDVVVHAGQSLEFAFNSVGITHDPATAQCTFIITPSNSPNDLNNELSSSTVVTPTTVFTESPITGLSMKLTVPDDMTMLGLNKIILRCVGLRSPAYTLSEHDTASLRVNAQLAYTRIFVPAFQGTRPSVSVTYKEEEWQHTIFNVVHTGVEYTGLELDSGVFPSHISGCNFDNQNGDTVIECHKIRSELMHRAFIAASTATITIKATSAASSTPELFNVVLYFPKLDYRAAQGSRVTADRNARTLTFVMPFKLLTSFYVQDTFAGLINGGSQCSIGHTNVHVHVQVGPDPNKHTFNIPTHLQFGAEDQTTVICRDIVFPIFAAAPSKSGLLSFNDKDYYSVPFSGYPAAPLSGSLSLRAPYPGVQSALEIKLEGAFPVHAPFSSITAFVSVPETASKFLAAGVSATGVMCKYTARDGSEDTKSCGDLNYNSAAGQVTFDLLDMPPRVAKVEVLVPSVTTGPFVSYLEAMPAGTITFSNDLPSGSVTLPKLVVPKEIHDFRFIRVGPLDSDDKLRPLTFTAPTESAGTQSGFEHEMTFYTPIGLPEGVKIEFFDNSTLTGEYIIATGAICGTDSAPEDCAVHASSILTGDARKLVITLPNIISLAANSTTDVNMLLLTPRRVSLFGNSYRFRVFDEKYVYGSGFYNPGPVSQSNTGLYVDIPTGTTTAQTIDFNIIVQLGTPFPVAKSQDILITLTPRRKPYFEFVSRDVTCAWDGSNADSVPLTWADDNRSFTVRYSNEHVNHTTTQREHLVALLKCTQARFYSMSYADSPDYSYTGLNATVAYSNGSVINFGPVPVTRNVISATLPNPRITLTNAGTNNIGGFSFSAGKWGDATVLPANSKVILLVTMFNIDSTSCTFNGAAIESANFDYSSSGSSFSFTNGARPLDISQGFTLFCSKVHFDEHTNTNIVLSINLPDVDNAVYAEVAKAVASLPSYTNNDVRITVGASTTATDVMTWTFEKFTQVWFANGTKATINLLRDSATKLFNYRRKEGLLLANCYTNEAGTGIVVATYAPPAPGDKDVLTFTVSNKFIATDNVFDVSQPFTVYCQGVITPEDRHFQEFASGSLNVESENSFTFSFSDDS